MLKMTNGLNKNQSTKELGADVLRNQDLKHVVSLHLGRISSFSVEKKLKKKMKVNKHCCGLLASTQAFISNSKLLSVFKGVLQFLQRQEMD